MYLRKLLTKCGIDATLYNNHVITKLTNHSKDCVKGAVFLAIKGYSNNGHQFIFEAINNGAMTIIYDEAVFKLDYQINYIKVDDCKKTLALMAKYFYKDISRKYYVITLVGTKGKSTSTTLLFDYLNYLGYKALLIGTNGICFNDELIKINNTTPDILTIYQNMLKYYHKGARYLIMEASSIGIMEKRLAYLDIDMIIFTNLGQDHLDYHRTVIDYKYSKGLLLNQMPFGIKKVVILNHDDENYHFYKKLCQANTISYGIKNGANYQASKLKVNIDSSRFMIETRGIKYLFETNLFGEFNVYNVLACFTAIDFLKLPLFPFVKMLKIYPPLDGRMNLIRHDNRLFVIDFAHTPESVYKVLEPLKQACLNHLIVIIGAGGNRDQSKRSLIGQICEDLADEIIFTNDNPRFEEPIEIIFDLIKDIKKRNYLIILNRKKAIEYAVEESKPHDIIAILGKGAEGYQEIQGVKYPFNDKMILNNLLYYE